MCPSMDVNVSKFSEMQEIKFLQLGCWNGKDRYSFKYKNDHVSGLQVLAKDRTNKCQFGKKGRPNCEKKKMPNWKKGNEQ